MSGRMTTTLKAHFDGKVIVPDEAVELPVGTPLHVAVATEPESAEARTAQAAAQRFLALARKCNLHVGSRTWTREDLYER